MQILTELNYNPNLVLALGYFDGMHLGHQAVIKSTVDYAKENNLKSAVITFKDHPCCHFYGVCPKYILSREDRENHIKGLGIDYLYELDFNDDLCSLNAKEYLEGILIKNFNPKAIFTGFNHYFGAQKSGDTFFLKENAQKYKYEYFEIAPQKIDNKIISSTLIRNSLHAGEIIKANEMLGHRFKISGKIIEGQKIGRTLEFKTANIEYPIELIDLPFGVFEVKTQYGKGIANFGIRPTISKIEKAVLETHILDFDKNIYDEILEIEFIRMIRKEEKFNNKEELISQIKQDIAQVYYHG